MNNKFKPEGVPDWVRWIAIDKDGECWVYDSKPHIEETRWYGSIYMGKSKFMYQAESFKDWRDELYTWK